MILFKTVLPSSYRSYQKRTFLPFLPNRWISVCFKVSLCKVYACVLTGYMYLDVKKKFYGEIVRG